MDGCVDEWMDICRYFAALFCVWSSEYIGGEEGSK